jgi:hypothetical protein
VKCGFLKPLTKAGQGGQKTSRKDSILCKSRNLLAEFMVPITAKIDKPRRKFLHQAVGAILLPGSLIVTEFRRRAHDDCSDIFHRLKRLLNHLASPRGGLIGTNEKLRRSSRVSLL